MRAGIVLGLLLAPALPACSDELPNIVIITVDALRPDHLARYGHRRATSPALDRILSRSTEWTNARTVEPLTAPALCSLLLSVPPHEHGATRNGLSMAGGADSLPTELRKAGYRSAAFVGSWVLADEATGLAAHFDHYEEVFDRKRWFGVLLKEGSADGVTAAAWRWIDRHEDRPFLAWLHLVEPHAPYVLQKEYAARLGLAPRLLTPAVDRYDTEIARVDEVIGRFVDRLEKRDQRGGSTFVVITSDHGESFGEHGENGHGRHLWDTTLRIPLAFFWPGRLPPMTIREPASSLDIAPTLLGVLGLPIPPDFRGADWSVVITGRGRVAPRTLLFEAHRSAVVLPGDARNARAGGLLELATLRRESKEILRTEEGTIQRFDLARDSGEQHPMRIDRGVPSEVKPKESIVRNALENGRPVPVASEELERGLRSLGYLK